MSPSYHFIQELASQMVEIPTDSILSRTIYNDENVKAILFGFAPGQELSEHTASMPAIIQIITGECTLILGEDKKEAGPGTWVFMESHLPHSLTAHSPVTMLLLLIK
jgi:quercetin dioxygenase-like cupin family protein